MLRARLATLTLAGSLFVLTSGCCSSLSERFQSWRNGSGYGAALGDCTCYENGVNGATVPGGIQLQPTTPVLVSPDPTFTPPPPMPTAPNGQPPRIVPIPATPMPWTGQQ
jgi:hypothetical protein